MFSVNLALRCWHCVVLQSKRHMQMRPAVPQRCVTRQTAFCRHVTALSGGVAIDAQCARSLAGMAHVNSSHNTSCGIKHLASDIGCQRKALSRHTQCTCRFNVTASGCCVAADALPTAAAAFSSQTQDRQQSADGINVSCGLEVSLFELCDIAWMAVHLCLQDKAVGIVSAHQHMLAITG